VALLEEVSSRLGTAGAASCIAAAARGTGAGRVSAEVTRPMARWPPGQLGGALVHIAEVTLSCACAWTSSSDGVWTSPVDQAQTPVQGRWRDAGRGSALWRSDASSLFSEGMFDRLKQIKVELNFEISQNKS
jgi:hypothetical protein